MHKQILNLRYNFVAPQLTLSRLSKGCDNLRRFTMHASKWNASSNQNKQFEVLIQARHSRSIELLDAPLRIRASLAILIWRTYNVDDDKWRRIMFYIPLPVSSPRRKLPQKRRGVRMQNAANLYRICSIMFSFRHAAEY